MIHIRSRIYLVLCAITALLACGDDEPTSPPCMPSASMACDPSPFDDGGLDDDRDATDEQSLDASEPHEDAAVQLDASTDEPDAEPPFDAGSDAGSQPSADADADADDVVEEQDPEDAAADAGEDAAEDASTDADAATCEDACTLSELACSDGVLAECVVDDGSGCTVWNAGTSCGAGFCFDDAHCGKKTLGDWGMGTLAAPAGVVVDGDGNVYIAGDVANGLHGHTTLGSRDGFLTRWSSDGVRAWTKLWGSSASDSLDAIAIGSGGEVLIAGTTLGNISAPVSGTQDCFAALWPADAMESTAPTWHVQRGTPGDDVCQAATFGIASDVFIAGRTNGVLSPAGTQSHEDAVLWRLSSSNGGTLGSTQWGTANDDTIYGLAMASDALYAVGHRNWLNGVSGESFLAKRSSDGATQTWQSTWDNTMSTVDFASCVAVDASDNAIAGSRAADGLFGSAGQGAIVKVSPAQSQAWALDVPAYANAFAIAPDGESFYVGNDNVGSPGGAATIEKRSASGALLWSTWAFATTGTLRVTGIAVLPDGRVVAVGFTPGVGNTPYAAWIGPE